MEKYIIGHIYNTSYLISELEAVSEITAVCVDLIFCSTVAVNRAQANLSFHDGNVVLT